MDDKAGFKKLKEILNLIQESFQIGDSDTNRELEKITGLLWKRTISNQLYTDTADSKKLFYNTTRVASFIILIQLLVYHILQTHSSDKNLPSLTQFLEKDNINRTLADLISSKLYKNEKDILKDLFEYDLFSLLEISKIKKDKLDAAIELITNSGLEQVKADVLGKLFHSLIPLEIRRKLAAFYSSNWAGKILSELSISHAEDKVLDLTCGSGTLLVEAYHTKKRLYQESECKLGEREIHRLILTSIFGADISVFATKLAQANLILQNPDDLSCSVNIISGDGLAILPEHRKFNLKKEDGDSNLKKEDGDSNLKKEDGNSNLKKEDGNSNLKKEDGNSNLKAEHMFPEVDCIIMNPPFSRQRDMSDSTISHIEKLLCSYGLGDYIDKKMGLHGYFILHADQFLKEGGFMSMILPATTFNADYTEKILKFLRIRKYSIKFVFEILTTKNTFSEDCAFKEYMVILQKGTYNEGETTLLISFLKEPTLETIPDLILAIKNKLKSNFFEIKSIKTQCAYQNAKWRELFLKSEDILNGIFDHPCINRYSQLKTTIRIFRGFDATYADYVMIPNKWWKIIRDDSECIEIVKEKDERKDNNGHPTLRIPKQYIVRAIRRTATAEEIIVKPDSYVINLNPSIIHKTSELAAFYNHYLMFMKQKIEEEWEKQKTRGHKRVVVPESWYAHPNKHHCDKTIGHLFHFYKYAIKTRKTTTPFTHEPASIHFGFGYVVQTPNDPFYAAWFNSSLYLLTLFINQQLFAKSFFKMTIDNFQSIMLPNYTYFSDENSQLRPKFKEIVESYWRFTNFTSKNMPFLPDQLKTRFKPRVDLDRAWLNALGYDAKQIEIILETLYTWLIDYIEKR